MFSYSLAFAATDLARLAAPTNGGAAGGAAAAAAAAAQSGPNAPRKSSCVKEIERIQQRREERRAAQRAHRDQGLDLDPSNPTYEFMMMIQCVF